MRAPSLGIAQSPSADLLALGQLERKGRPRGSEATARIEVRACGISDFEQFVDGIGFLATDERNRMKLAGGEIFDNLVRHALPLQDATTIVRAARRPSGLFLAFYFKSASFASYAAGSSCVKSEDDELPFFDPLIGRWRGIGLRMCRNLSASLVLRAGSRIDRIYIAF